MLISTKGRYALRIMVDIAENQFDKYIPLKDIAERQGISEKYMEAIMPPLIKSKFLIALRGKGGGYKLARDPRSYTVGSILRQVENSLAPVACLDDEANGCKRAQECRTLPMWQNLYKIVNGYFDGITLSDLCAEVRTNDCEIIDS